MGIVAIRAKKQIQSINKCGGNIMQSKLTAWKLAIFASGVIAIALMFSAPIYASDTLHCQYQGVPDSVIRLSPGFGDIFGAFSLINSSSNCPNNITTIQFSGSSAVDSANFVSTIETCLDMASLLVVKNGLVTVDLHDPLTGGLGVVIANYQALPVVNSCRISRRAE
jgi:hypothetical protein